MLVPDVQGGMTETVPTAEGTVAATTRRDPVPVDEGPEEPTGPSHTTVRFGLGFVAGMLLAAVAGVATGALGPAIMFGVALGMLAGVAYAELVD